MWSGTAREQLARDPHIARPDEQTKALNVISQRGPSPSLVCVSAPCCGQTPNQRLIELSKKEEVFLKLFLRV